MSPDEQDELVVPVVREEVHVDAVPVQTGGVRVTKHTEGHEQLLEQELRRGRVEVKRVKTERVVDGPQQVYRSGTTLVIPVVSEVLKVEKQWVVTEEIHVTQLEERETVQQKVLVNEEQARIERIDEHGNVVSTLAESTPTRARGLNLEPDPIASRTKESAPSPKRFLTDERSGSILRKRPGT